MKPTLSISPSLLALPRDADGHVDVLVELKAPAAPEQAKRPSLSLAIVIDRSGSMSGKPLEEAKRAALHLLSKLQPGDQACIASYGSTVTLDAEPMDAVAGRAQLIAAVERLQSAGGTPLRAGWLCGANALAPFVSQHGLSRVLLLSDGQATDNSVPEILAEESRQLMGAGISTSTYGLGNHFNEDLMTKLAQGGQAFYAENADALVAYFEAEFAMLAATVGRQVALDITASLDSVRIERLDTAQAVAGPVHLSPLVSGASSWVALRVTHPALAAKADLGLTVRARWVGLDGAAHEAAGALEIPVRAKAKPAPASDALERLKEAEAARLQQEALAKARLGDWEGAQGVIRGIAAASANNAYIAGVAASLTSVADTRDLQRFAKEATYSSYAMANRVVDEAESVDTLDGGRFGLRKAEQGKAAPKAGRP